MPSDRYQPEGNTMFLFRTNPSKYIIRSNGPEANSSPAQLHSLKTPKDQRSGYARKAKDAINHKPQEQFVVDFNLWSMTMQRTITDDFKSPQAKDLQKISDKRKDYHEQAVDKPTAVVCTCYLKKKKLKIASSILDLEKRVRQMSRELDEEAIIIRNTEIQYKNNKTMDVLIIIVLIIAVLYCFGGVIRYSGNQLCRIAALGCIILPTSILPISVRGRIYHCRIGCGLRRLTGRFHAFKHWTSWL